MVLVLSPHVENHDHHAERDAPLADLLSAPRDEPSTCRALSAQRRPRGAARTQGHGVETPANQDTDVVIRSDKWIPQLSRRVSTDGDTAHRATKEQGTEHTGGEKMTMNRTKSMWFASALVLLAQIAITPSAQAQVLTGDARLACEALLCLSAVGQAPGECSKALAKYEAMKAQLWFNPMAVYNFLKGCPKK